MIYKLIVNAAFLAIGYYIGKQVGLSELVQRKPADTQKSPSQSTSKKPRGHTPEK